MTRDRRPSPDELRKAAFDDLEAHGRHAWKSDFQQKLAVAKSHLPSTRPHTEADRRAVQDLIAYLREYLAGRPVGPRPPWDEQAEQPHPINEHILVTAAERAAGVLVRGGRKSWCQENHCKRMKPSKLDELIADSIGRIVFQWGIPKATASKISAAEVRQLANKK
jgi:hypothetical protein